jgi:hypothetical protein
MLQIAKIYDVEVMVIVKGEQNSEELKLMDLPLS